MSKFSTYALTIRPLNGVSDDDVKSFTRFVTKRCTYYSIITEKSGSERHLHAGLFLTKSVTRSNVVQSMKQLFKHLTSSEQTVLFQGIKIMYNFDFITKYMDKDDDTVVIAQCLPEQSYLDSIFPKLPAAVKKVPKHSAFYHELESLWYKHTRPVEEANPVNCRHFLCNMMYKERLINVIRDDKQIIQVSRHLARWLNKVDEWDGTEIAPFEKDW